MWYNIILFGCACERGTCISESIQLVCYNACHLRYILLTNLLVSTIAAPALCITAYMPIVTLYWLCLHLPLMIIVQCTEVYMNVTILIRMWVRLESGCVLLSVYWCLAIMPIHGCVVQHMRLSIEISTNITSDICPFSSYCKSLTDTTLAITVMVCVIT